MENASQALQMAAWVLIFVVALSISIAMFGQANTALNRIIEYNNNRTLYTYVESKGSNRVVGIETVIPTMYRAYKENYRVEFYKSNNTEFELYTVTVKDDSGKDVEKSINYIDLEKETLGSPELASLHLDEILANGLYDELSKCKFTEEIGEYYMEDAKEEEMKKEAEAKGEIYEPSKETIEANKTKKRVITYTIK